MDGLHETDKNETTPLSATSQDRGLTTRDILRSIDLNAHVENVSVRIDTSDSKPTALVSFTNLGYGTITAIKFKARGFNAFEDEVLIAGKNQFLLIIQDISIPSNQQADNLNVNLPSDEIRRLELQESQVCFEDGVILSYEGAKHVEFTQRMLDGNPEDNLLHAALRNKFGDTFRYVPVILDEGWVCGCGRFNANEQERCSLCNQVKDSLFDSVSDEAKDAILEEYEEFIKRKEEEEKERAEAKAKHKKKLIRYGIIGGAILAVLIVIIALTSNYMSRKHFTSEDEMRNAISGVYTEDASYSRSSQLKIENGKMIWRLDQSDTSLDIDSDITSYDPGNGSFTAGGSEVTVMSNGDLKYLDDIYKKGGSWTKLSTSTAGSSSTKYESAYTALSISGSVSNSGSGYTRYNGTIKNNGSKSYRFVQVKGSFKDKSGTVLDTDWTYAVGSEGLSPGESKSFTLSVKKNSSIKDCSVSIIEYQ